LDSKELELLQKRYELTEEEYKDYFNAVNMFFTTGKKPVERPKLVFVVGQPGAGKSKLTPLINRQLGYNAVASDIDVIRSLHKNYQLVNTEAPEELYRALIPAIDKADKELRAYCIQSKLNVIYEGTMRATQGYVDMAEMFRSAGYDIEVAVMAVPELESYGSSILRYATDLMSNNSPRWVIKEAHDAAYENLIVTLREFEKRGLATRASVYRRGHDKQGTPVRIYSTEERQFESPAAAVIYGREKYRRDSVARYPMKHDIVTEIISAHSPEMLPKLSQWEALYEREKQSLIDKGPQKD